MRGSVLSFDLARGEGLILGDDGNRSTFNEQSWSDRSLRPVAGLSVDFVADGAFAKDIFPIRQTPAALVVPSPTSQSQNDGTLLGGLSLGSALLGLLPGFGILFIIGGFVLGILARKQAKLAANSTGATLGTIGIIISSVVVVIEVVAVFFLGAMLTGLFATSGP